MFLIIYTVIMQYIRGGGGVVVKTVVVGTGQRKMRQSSTFENERGKFQEMSAITGAVML